VAISKTKPPSAILEAYEVSAPLSTAAPNPPQAGQRRFGENYAQELVSKAAELPPDVEWHFVGPLQSNKAASLVKALGAKLKCVETVSTKKLASKLSRAVGEAELGALGVYLQVNTSGEESKSGLKVEELLDFAREIAETCPNLRLDGLMTIGAPGEVSDFDVLRECRHNLASGLGVEECQLGLSMGMSGDFEVAIAHGATSVRVGSTIFGARDYSK